MKSVISLGIAGVLASSPAIAQAPLVALPHDEALSQAKLLERHGDFVAAESALRTYLATHPGSAEALYALGSVLHHENRPTDSLATYTSAAAIVPPTPEDLRVVALNYVLLQDYTDAVQWLQRALQTEPGNAEIWYDLARTRMMQLNFNEAEIALKRSLAILPESVKAENNLGVTYEAENRSDDAVQAYQNAISWQKNSPHPSEQPLLNYGKLLIDQNKSGEAVGLLEEAVKIAPNDPKCHEQLARALDRTGSERSASGKADPSLHDRAQAEMLEAIRLDPSNARLHFQLGLMYRRAGKLDLARQQTELSGKLYGSHATNPDN